MKLAVTHRNSSSLKVANNTIISYFSLLLLLGLAQFHDRKPIFRGTLDLIVTFCLQLKIVIFRSYLILITPKEEPKWIEYNG